MADAVEQLLERHIPALRDLADRGIMTTEEIRGLVDQRRHFEYRLQRRSPRKIDFIRYIEYEGKVDALRRLRKQRLKLLKQTVSDFAQTQHIFFIFERACRKFQADPDMWLQYIDFAAKEKAEKRLGTLFPRALQLHPRHTGLWIKAASWQYFELSNASGARVLLQRALRMNPHAEPLWHEYFRLELHYVAKIGQRKAVLGIGGRPAEGKGASESGNDGGSEDDDEEEDVDSSFHLGAVPKTVFVNAVKNNPTAGLGFRVSFLRICNEFDNAQHVVATILDSLAQDFGEDPDAWVVRATFHLGGGGGSDSGGGDSGKGEKSNGEAEEGEEEGSSKKKRRRAEEREGEGLLSEAEAASVRVMEEGVAAKSKDPNMWAAYVHVLRSFSSSSSAARAGARSSSSSSSSGVGGAARAAGLRARLEGVFERAAGCLTPRLFLDWARLDNHSSSSSSSGSSGVDRSEAIIRRGLLAHPASSELWTALVQLKHWTHVMTAAATAGGAAAGSLASAQEKEMLGLVEEALAACLSSTSSSLSSASAAAAASTTSPTVDLVTALYQPLLSRFPSHATFSKALAHCSTGATAATEGPATQLCCQYLRWAASTSSTAPSSSSSAAEVKGGDGSSSGGGEVAGALKVQRKVINAFGPTTPGLLPFFVEFINVLRLAASSSSSSSSSPGKEGSNNSSTPSIRAAYEAAVSCAAGSSNPEHQALLYEAYADFELGCSGDGDPSRADAVRWRAASAARSN
jgi:hypothetical protein